MARDILSEYGPESPMNQRPRATSGGVTQARDVMNYQPPAGPKTLGDRGPGLHADNYGNCGTQTGGRRAETSGSPGNHGSNKGYGTNRG